MENVNANTIYLKQMELGPMQNFVYLVGDPQTRECVVVDPAWEIDTIVETAQADGMTLTGALVTHTHQDHVGGSLESWGMPGRIPGLEELLERVKAKVRVHRSEEHTSELQSRLHLVCRLLLEKKKRINRIPMTRRFSEKGSPD